MENILKAINPFDNPNVKNLENFANPNLEDISVACTMTDYLNFLVFLGLAQKFARHSKFPATKLEKVNFWWLRKVNIGLAFIFGIGGLTHQFFIDKNSVENQFCWSLIHLCISAIFVYNILSPLMIYFGGQKKSGNNAGRINRIFNTLTVIWVIAAKFLDQYKILSYEDNFTIIFVVRALTGLASIRWNFSVQCQPSLFMLSQILRMAFLPVFLMYRQVCSQANAEMHGCPFPNFYNHNAVFHNVMLLTFALEHLSFL